MPPVLSFIALRGPNASAPLLANSSTIRPLRFTWTRTLTHWASRMQCKRRWQCREQFAAAAASAVATSAGNTCSLSRSPWRGSISCSSSCIFHRVLRLCPELFDETVRSIPSLNDAERDCCKLKALAVSTLLSVHLVDTFFSGCILYKFRCRCISWARCSRAVSCRSGPS